MPDKPIPVVPVKANGTLLLASLSTSTVTLPTKSLTGFPETSLTETIGCVPKTARLAAEAASWVRNS